MLMRIVIVLLLLLLPACAQRLTIENRSAPFRFNVGIDDVDDRYAEPRRKPRAVTK